MWPYLQKPEDFVTFTEFTKFFSSDLDFHLLKKLYKRGYYQRLFGKWVTTNKIIRAEKKKLLDKLHAFSELESRFDFQRIHFQFK